MNQIALNLLQDSDLQKRVDDRWSQIQLLRSQEGGKVCPNQLFGLRRTGQIHFTTEQRLGQGQHQDCSNILRRR